MRGPRAHWPRPYPGPAWAVLRLKSHGACDTPVTSRTRVSSELSRVWVASLWASRLCTDDSDSALDVIEREQEHGRLAKCLDELEERQQTVIRAAFLDGATYPELSEREAVPLGTMKSWIRRGLLRLRGCLER